MRLRVKSLPISGHSSVVTAATWTLRSYVHRHGLFPFRMSRYVCPAMVYHQLVMARWMATNNTAAAFSPVSITHGAESDFVDLGHGIGCNLSVVTNDENNKQKEQQPILGVARQAEVSENQEYSRLNILLAPSADGRRTELRPNSRSAVTVDGSLCITPEEKQDVDPKEVPSSSTKNSGDYAKASLPYDDEHFAEILLQMEVEGTIDEVWQDARKSHMEDVKELVEVLKSLKVRDICAVDVSAKTSNFDYMVFGTCEGPRHIHLAAWAVQEADSQQRVSKIKRKQTDHTWEVVPVGRIVVNLMQESMREELSLERKWAVTKSMDPLSVANAPVSEGRMVKAHGLWTLTLNLQDLEDFEVDYCKDVLMRQL